MGKATVVNYTDDMTGKPIERTEVEEVSVIVGGMLYTLDLGAASVAKYVTPLTEKAPTKRRFSGASSNIVPINAKRAQTPDAVPSGQAMRIQNQIIREWWKRNPVGQFTHNDRGRIPQDVLDAYRKHGGQDIPKPAKPVQTLPDALRAKPAKTTAKPVAAVGFSDAETESKPLTPAKKAAAVAAAKSGRVPASRAKPAKAPAEAKTPAASRARGRTVRP